MTMANAKELSEKMKDFELVFRIKAGDNGKIFGSVSSKEIADSLEKQYKINIDKKKIELKEPIKVLGVRTVDVKLFEGVTGKIKINVILFQHMKKQ